MRKKSVDRWFVRYRTIILKASRLYTDIFNILSTYTHNMQEVLDCKWTDVDEAICERAESSGLAINTKTGEPLRYSELKTLSSQYQKVKSNVTVDEFLKDKINSKPFGF